MAYAKAYAGALSSVKRAANHALAADAAPKNAEDQGPK